MRETRADIGIALDGDADRLIIVDNNGKVVDGDQLMALIAIGARGDARQLDQTLDRLVDRAQSS